MTSGENKTICCKSFISHHTGVSTTSSTKSISYLIIHHYNTELPPVVQGLHSFPAHRCGAVSLLRATPGSGTCDSLCCINSPKVRKEHTVGGDFLSFYILSLIKILGYLIQSLQFNIKQSPWALHKQKFLGIAFLPRSMLRFTYLWFCILSTISFSWKDVRMKLLVWTLYRA